MDRAETQLVYHSPCPSNYILELSGVISAMMLKCSLLVSLGDFDIYAKAPSIGIAQDFMIAIVTMVYVIRL